MPELRACRWKCTRHDESGRHIATAMRGDEIVCAIWGGPIPSEELGIATAEAHDKWLEELEEYYRYKDVLYRNHASALGEPSGTQSFV